MSENENNQKFSLSEGSLLEKEKVLGSNPAPSTKLLVQSEKAGEISFFSVLHKLMRFLCKCTLTVFSLVFVKRSAYQVYFNTPFSLEPVGSPDIICPKSPIG